MLDHIKWTMWTTFRQFLVKFSTLRQFWGQSSSGSFPAFPIPFRSMEELLQICEDSLCITDVFTFTVHASFSYFFFVSICITFFDSEMFTVHGFLKHQISEKALCSHHVLRSFIFFPSIFHFFTSAFPLGRLGWWSGACTVRSEILTLPVWYESTRRQGIFAVNWKAIFQLSTKPLWEMYESQSFCWIGNPGVRTQDTVQRHAATSKFFF